MVDLILVFNLFYLDKSRWEILYWNQYIYFLITPIEEIIIYERLFFELLNVTIKCKKGAVSNIQDQYKLVSSISC